MKRLTRAILALFLLSAPLWAAGAASTSVAVNAKSDRVDIHLQSDSPMTYKEKMLGSSMLAIEVSPAHLKAGTPKKIAVDKGLIQNISLEQHGNAVTIKIAVISRPKQLKANLDAGGRKLTLSYSTADIATSKPAGFASVAPGKPAKPTAASTRAAKPVPAIRPSTPTPSGTVPVRPLSPTVSSTAAPPSRTSGSPHISVTFSGTSLEDVFVKLADEAGLVPQIFGQLEGSYSGSFSNTPLDEALREVCKGRAITCEVVNGSLYVRNSPGAASVPSATGSEPAAAPSVTPVASAPEPVLPAGPLAREYYPIRTQSAQVVVDSARTILPNIRYTVDLRLNIVMAEGSPADIDKLSSFLKDVSAK